MRLNKKYSSFNVIILENHDLNHTELKSSRPTLSQCYNNCNVIIIIIISPIFTRAMVNKGIYLGLLNLCHFQPITSTIQASIRIIYEEC